MSQLQRLIRDMDKIKFQLAATTSTPQLAHSSLENGSIDSYDAAGNLRLRIGEQGDGTQTITVVDGPTPPAPSAPLVAVDGPVLTVSWDGQLADPDLDLPADFARIHVHVSQAPDMEAAPVRASIEARAGASTVTAVDKAGTWWVALAVEAQSGKRSPLSDPVEAVVTLVDLGGALDAVSESANGKNRITWSPDDPPSDYTGPVGDVWWKTSSDPEDPESSRLVGQWSWDGSKWVGQALSHETIASLDLGKATVGELDGARIKFRSASGEILTLDALDGKVVTGTVVQTARSGARVVLGEDGLSVFNAADDWRVRLTPDGSMFKGDLEAESLVATGPVELRHAGNSLAPAAELALAAGVGDPTGPPTVQPVWPSIDFQLPWTPKGRVEFTGLAFDGTHFWTTAQEWSPDGKSTVSHYCLRVDPVTGKTTRPGQWGFLEVPYGVACIGDRLYWMINAPGFHYFSVRVTDLAGNWKIDASWEDRDAGWSKTNPLVYRPSIGATADGNLVIAQCTDAGSLIWRTYTTAGELLTTVDCKDSTRSDITGVYYGAADHGSTNATVLKAVSRSIEMFDPSGRWQPGLSWQTAERQNESGLCYAGGHFHTVVQAAEGTAGRIVQYAGPEMGGGDWWAAYRWAAYSDRDGNSEHLSRIGPPRSFTWPARAQLKILGADLPDGVTSIAPVLARQKNRPSRTEFRTPAWKGTIGKPEAVYEVLPADWTTTPAPADANSFPDAEPAVLRSANRQVELRGDGSAKFGPLVLEKGGQLTGVPVVAGGTAVVPITAANANTRLTVTFPAGRFSAPPTVTAVPITPDPQTSQVSVNNITTRSFELVGRRTVAAAAYVSWTAIENR